MNYKLWSKYSLVLSLLVLMFSCADNDDKILVVEPIEIRRVEKLLNQDSILNIDTKLILSETDSSQIVKRLSYKSAQSKIEFLNLYKSTSGSENRFYLPIKAKAVGKDTVSMYVDKQLIVQYHIEIKANPTSPEPENPTSYTLANLLKPTVKGEFVQHTYYQLSYIEKHEGAEWVSHLLTKKMLEGTTDRDDDFRADPKVTTGTADEDDYTGTDYDRGHLCPASDMKINTTAMSESFFMSNMSPQQSSFNRGMWSRVEDIQREIATQEDSVVIISGPVFDGDLGTIGTTTKITVPGHFYKIVYDITGEQKIYAWLFPNNKLNKGDGYNPDQFSVSVDKIEQETGIDFFSQLPDDIEQKLEAEVNKK